MAADTTVKLAIGAELSDPSHSAVINLTGVDPDANTSFTAYPCLDGRPLASNLNPRPGGRVANAAIITPDANGDICVYTRQASHMVVDLLGEIGPVFEGFTPLRVTDTRLS